LAETAKPAHGHEAGHAGEDERLAAEEVAEFAGDRDGDGRGEQVSGGDPGVTVEAVELGDDPRHRGADDGLVESGEKQREHDADGDEDQSAAGHLHYVGHTFSSSLVAVRFRTSFRQR
jgi:hypothetical protein